MTTTATELARSVIVEKDCFSGAYDMLCNHAIINHPRYGRVYICQGWGGQGSVAGERYRWRHGSVYRIMPNDTLATLQDARPTMRYFADPDRPCLSIGWDGYQVERMAISAGL